jgi:hypothetical protein
LRAAGIDVGKLIFASIVLGTIIKGDIDKTYLLFLGSAIALVCICGGIYLHQKRRIKHGACHCYKHRLRRLDDILSDTTPLLI